ncbi:hypothetical protein BC940DRAFT_290626 [Gongronella butleri]|nr:hypothetical protein BC940DRAFT_290626 [Gongronella butleri]
MVFYSQHPPVEIPMMGIVDFVFSNPNKMPDSRHILLDAHSDRSMTFGQVKQAILQFAAGLQDHCQFQHGDVLAIFAPNMMDYCIPLLGTLAAGGTATTANPAYTVSELVHQLTTASAKVIVCSVDNAAVALEAAAKSGIAASNVFVFGEKPSAQGLRPYTQALLPGRQLEKPVAIANPLDQVAYMCFSSGTTGLSKGVMSTHTNITSNIIQADSHLRSYIRTDSDKVLNVLPNFHIFGLVVVIQLALYWGTPMVVMSKFDLEHFCQTVQKHKINFACVVPPILLLLSKMDVVDKYDMSSLRTLMSGAAPLSAELTKDVSKRLPGCHITQGYGLTETSPVVTVGPKYNTRLGASGPLLPNITAKIVNEEGQEVGVGERGELWVKGPNIMKGYIKNPKATEGCMDYEGYFHTGDIVIMDKDGHLHIVDRLKELIKYKGFQVPPAELEGILLSSPLVADCAVVGVYDAEQATELPRAYIVLKAGVEASDETDKALKKFVADQVVHYKQVRSIKFIDAIPRSAAGKILRRLLRDQANNEQKDAKAKL